MFRIRINGVTEKDQLEQRNADHHRESQTIATHLDELLCQHRAESRHREYARSFHDEELSFELSMRWMKTSSSPDSTGCHSYRSVRNGAIPCSRAAASPPLTCNMLPNATVCSTPGRPRNCSVSLGKSSPLTDQVVRRSFPITSLTAPCVSSLP